MSGSAQGAVTVGIVFLQAIVLYVGYGALTRLAQPTILGALGGE
ncbi:hypothetical protein [Halolamina sp. CBA1230]|nr:hypothetical protein [Halolamina sp. CBA1230]